jgi:hypothetical protein
MHSSSFKYLGHFKNMAELYKNVKNPFIWLDLEQVSILSEREPLKTAELLQQRLGN